MEQAQPGMDASFTLSHIFVDVSKIDAALSQVLEQEKPKSSNN
jgi:hypothetical protein